MSTEPQLLPYATQDANVVRFQRPFVIWCVAVGALALVTVAIDLLTRSNSLFSQLRDLSTLIRWRGRWALGEIVEVIHQFVPFLAAPCLALAVLLTRRHGWTVSLASLRLIRAAAVVLLVSGAGMGAYQLFSFLRVELPISVSLLQIASYLSTELLTQLVAPALLLAASTRRFHDEPRFAQRLILYGVLAQGICLTVILIDQGWRWLLGTPPWWTMPLDPQLVAASAPLTVRLFRFQQLVSQPLGFLHGLIALFVAAVGLRTNANRRPLFLLLVLALLIPWGFSLVMSVLLHVLGGYFSVGRLTWMVLTSAMSLLLPVLAWCSVRGENATS